MVVDLDSLAVPGRAGGVPDGEHMAVLVGQGDQLLQESSLPDAGAGGHLYLPFGALLERGAVYDCDHLHVLGHLGAGGLLMVAPAQKAFGKPSRPHGRRC